MTTRDRLTESALGRRPSLNGIQEVRGSNSIGSAIHFG